MHEAAGHFRGDDVAALRKILSNRFAGKPVRNDHSLRPLNRVGDVANGQKEQRNHHEAWQTERAEFSRIACRGRQPRDGAIQSPVTVRFHGPTERGAVGQVLGQRQPDDQGQGRQQKSDRERRAKSGRRDDGRGPERQRFAVHGLGPGAAAGGGSGITELLTMRQSHRHGAPDLGPGAVSFVSLDCTLVSLGPGKSREVVRLTEEFSFSAVVVWN